MYDCRRYWVRMGFNNREVGVMDFKSIFTLLFNSLETGSGYALAALGIVLIFRTSRTTHSEHRND